MTTLIENSIEIARTPEDVFDYLSDMGNEVRWNPDWCRWSDSRTGRSRSVPGSGRSGSRVQSCSPS